MILLGHATVNIAIPLTNYTSLRNKILEHDLQLMIGANLILNDVEKIANEVLMKAKKEELYIGLFLFFKILIIFWKIARSIEYNKTSLI